VVTLALPRAFPSGTSRLQLSIPLRGPGPRPACRRRALEAVEKFVTGSWAAVSAGFGRCLLLIGSNLVEAGLIRYPL